MHNGTKIFLKLHQNFQTSAILLVITYLLYQSPNNSQLNHQYIQRPLEALKQVEAKNLSSSSASLKKLRPGAVLTLTQFRAKRNKHVHIRTCLFLFARNWVEVSTAPGPSFLKLFLNFLKLFSCPKQKF